jgi:tetratricopeptide (TPR) repeat protein
MRILSAFCGAALTAAAFLPAFAAEPDPGPAEQPVTDAAPAASAPADTASSESREENRLNALFAELKRERNEKAAERIANRIWEAWAHSGSASIDLMMGWSKTAMDAKKFDVALDFLDQVVTISPAYAEGWNRRATVHFMMQNYAKSMADINHTLQLEPRHFGALSGMGQILKSAGNNELALQAYQRVLDIYPMMRAAQNEVATLSEELAGEGI